MALLCFILWLCIVKNGQNWSTYSPFLDPGTEDPTCSQTQKRGEKSGFETPKAQNCRTNLQGRWQRDWDGNISIRTCAQNSTKKGNYFNFLVKSESAVSDLQSFHDFFFILPMWRKSIPVFDEGKFEESGSNGGQADYKLDSDSSPRNCAQFLLVKT